MNVNSPAIPEPDILPEMRNLAERLALAMRGPPPVTAAELARACGVSKPSVTNWLNGRTRVLKGASLLAASRKLNVNTDWLAAGRGPMRENVVNPSGPSQSVRIDPAILAAAFKFLRQSVEASGFEYEPDADPDLLALAYEFLAEQADPLQPTNVLDFGKKARELQESRGAYARRRFKGTDS